MRGLADRRYNEVEAQLAALRAYATPPSSTATQNWVVDPVGGNDASQTGPLQTLSAFFAKIRGTVDVNYTVTVLSDTLPTDIADVVFTQGTGSVSVSGVPTVQRSSVLTAGTVTMNRTTNQRQVLADTTFANDAWAPQVARRMRITGGARGGTSAWVSRNIAGTKTVFASAPRTLAGTPSTVVIGDPYEIVTVPKIRLGLVSIDSRNTGATTKPLEMSDCQIDPAGSLGSLFFGLPNTPFVPGVQFTRCLINQAIGCTGGLGPTLMNCCISPAGYMQTESGGFMCAVGGTNLGVVASATQGSTIILDGDYIIYGEVVSASNSIVIIGSAAAFESFDHGFFVHDASNMRVEPINGGIFDGVGALWGNTNVADGLHITAGGVCTLDPAVTPIVTGAAGDFNIGTTVGTARAWDEAGGVFTAAIPATWANWIKSIATGGFEKRATSPGERCGIYVASSA